MAEKYDDTQDGEVFGLQGADFPVTVYDRPQFMFSNLLRGDIDGVTRAMLSPSTMTPSQMRTVQDLYAPHTKKNKVLKTIIELSTNPLVIAGLVMSLKYPLGTTKPLLMLRKGLLPKAATMGKMFSGLHDAQFNLRTIPGMFEKVNKVVSETQDFVTKYGERANQIFLKSGNISKAQGAVVAARLDGLHKADHYMVKALQNEPEWQAFFGAKDVPIAPNIQNSMDDSMRSLADRLRGWFKHTRQGYLADPKVASRMKNAVEKQGLQWGGEVEDYFPRRGQFNKYQQRSLRGATGVEYRKYLDDEVTSRVAKSDIARTGGMFIDPEDARLLEKTGAIRPGFTDQVLEPILARKSAEASGAIGNIWDDVARLGLDEAKERKAFIAKTREYFTKGEGKGKGFLSHLGSDRTIDETLDSMAAALQDARTGGPADIAKEISDIGTTIARPGSYGLNLWDSTSGYLSSVAKAHAWHGTGLGQEIDTLMKSPQARAVFHEAPYLESYLKDDLLPHARGIKSYKQMQRSLNFSVQKEKIYNWIQKTPFVESALGTKTKDWMLNYFGQGPKSITADALSAQISHTFYLSTLGANISPASKNLLQNFITTMNVPGIGAQGLYRGLMGVGKHEGALVKMQRYVGMISKGIPPAEAFRKAFPEYVKDMGEGSKILETMMAGEVGREGYTKLLAPGGAWDKVKAGMLMPFSTSEAFNRITGYYAGRNSHIFHNAGRLAKASAEEAGKILAEAGQVGQSLTMVSHFTGGPLGVPKAIMNLPSAARQYMMFPLRYAGYLHGSLRMGADPNKLDWGTIGRTLTGSTAAYIGARNMLGVDLSGSLATGALPVPTYENAPFYPFPLVPPVAALAGTLGKAVLTGDPSQLGAAAAMVLPGGIGIRRAYKALHPRYADYENKTEDGRIPVYNSDHALVGTLSPTQMFLRSIGIRTVDQGAETGAAEWLAKNRDRIRGYRREYLEALASNDLRKADKVNADFRKAYPEMGDIQVKKSDIKAVRNRRETSRVNRIANGLPSAYRPIFSQILNDAAMSETIKNIGTTDLGAIPQFIQ